MESRFQREIFKRSINIQVDDELAEVLRNIDNGYRIIILMRGLPGSGKSTLARYIVEHSVLEDKQRHILSADDYFYQRGKYMYDPNKISDAHSWNQSRTKNFMLQGFSPLIIDNTNCVAWEMHVYMKDAVANGYVVKILEPRTSWSFRTKELTYKNSHNVPLQKIKRMMEKYERGLTVEGLLRAWNLTYSPEMTPPILRSSPQINPIPNCSSSTQKESNSLTLMHDKPKPQRNQENTNKQSKKGLLLLNSDISVDWAPIDETFNSWPSEFPMNNSKISPSSSISKCDASMNTCSIDINNREGFKIIWGFSREINDTSLQNLNLVPKFMQTMFDKSTMTDEIYDVWKNMEGKPNSKKYQQELDQLKMLFPDVYLDNLRDVLEHCKGDINLAGNTLLDSEKLIQITKQPEEILTDVNDVEDESNEPLDEEIIELNSIEQPSEIPNDECNFKIAEDQTNLKKVIEMNFDFSDDHYSNHVLKIKRRNRGEKPNNPETVSENPKDEIGECSKNLVNGKMEIEESTENDTVVSVNVGNQFIEELEKIFDSSYSISDHLNPIIHMPMSLVHQIHALWLESLYDQIYMQQELSRKFIKEDEEFAKTIEMLENSQENLVTVQETPNLQEIMDMEMALALYKADVMELRKETTDNMASRLTHQKLVQLFPGVSSNILKEIHNAHNNKFEQTVEALMSSTGLLNSADSESDKKRAIQEFLMKNERDLLERARKEKERVFNENANNILGDNSSSTSDRVSLDLYRQEANRHLQIRNLNYTKAQEYLRKGMTQVASYYSNIASLHTKRHDFATTMVASEMVQMSSSKGDFTLDLHHLNVIEAVKVLDLFIDKHILRIQQEVQTKINPGLNTVVKLFLVTGRGRHSPGGQPKIKPAICKRLRERQIRYNEINPGLIGVYLTPEIGLNIKNN